LFAQQGYTATSMRQIAEETGIGKATIYHHFRDKETILMTLVDSNTTQMLNSLDIIGAETNPRRRIQVAAEVLIRFLYSSAELLQIARREVPAARERMLSFFMTSFSQIMALLEESFREGIEMKLFRPIDPHATAEVFMIMIQGNFAMLYVTGKRSESPEKAAAQLLDGFFNGINTGSVVRLNKAFFYHFYRPNGRSKDGV